MSDLDALAALESECFPPAEAASRDAIADRLRTYADHFWLLFDDDRLTAAINGMVTDEPDLLDAIRPCMMSAARGRCCSACAPTPGADGRGGRAASCAPSSKTRAVPGETAWC